jgi:hypothetical protein
MCSKKAIKLIFSYLDHTKIYSPLFLLPIERVIVNAPRKDSFRLALYWRTFNNNEIEAK